MTKVAIVNENFADNVICKMIAFWVCLFCSVFCFVSFCFFCLFSLKIPRLGVELEL